jgi:iron complex transport system substrate-binding protein
MAARPRGPQRVVCLTEETTEWLWALGEQRRIVGISAYTERPPEARDHAPVVSAFIGGSVEKIARLKPDLVVGFSDVQAGLARELISAGLPVLVTNQRSVQEIFDVLAMIAGIVGAHTIGDALLDGYQRRLDAAGERAARRAHKPRVYFEEWDEPMISAIRWVGELIALAGGVNVFEAESHAAASKGRVVTVERVRAAQPEVVLASWCGKPLDEAAMRARLGDDLPAMRAGRVHEVSSTVILQPGPACLTDGIEALESLLATP